MFDLTLIRDYWQAFGRVAPNVVLFMLFAAASVGSFFMADTWGEVLVPPLVVLAVMALFKRTRRTAPLAVALFFGVFAVSMLGEMTFRLRYFGADAVTHPMLYSPIIPVSTGAYDTLSVTHEDPGIGYGMQPGYAGWLKGAPISFNSEGYRGEEFTIEKAPGVFRIAFLGDSIVMGSGVQEHETMSEQVESNLNERCPGTFEILNLGVRGMDMGQIARRMELDALRYSPDMIIVGYPSLRVGERTAADPPDWDKKLAGTEARFRSYTPMRRNGFLLNILPSYTEVTDRVKGMLGRTAKGKPNTVTFTDSVVRMQEIAHSNGIPLVMIPIRKMNFGDSALMHALTGTADTTGRAQHEKIDEIMAELGVESIDTYDAFAPDSIRLDFTIFPGDDHPNPESLQIFGAWIADALIERGLVPCE